MVKGSRKKVQKIQCWIKSSCSSETECGRRKWKRLIIDLPPFADHSWHSKDATRCWTSSLQSAYLTPCCKSCITFTPEWQGWRCRSWSTSTERRSMSIWKTTSKNTLLLRICKETDQNNIRVGIRKNHGLAYLPILQNCWVVKAISSSSTSAPKVRT